MLYTHSIQRLWPSTQTENSHEQLMSHPENIKTKSCLVLHISTHLTGARNAFHVFLSLCGQYINCTEAVTMS